MDESSRDTNDVNLLSIAVDKRDPKEGPLTYYSIPSRISRNLNKLFHLAVSSSYCRKRLSAPSYLSRQFRGEDICNKKS